MTSKTAVFAMLTAAVLLAATPAAFAQTSESIGIGAAGTASEMAAAPKTAPAAGKVSFGQAKYSVGDVVKTQEVSRTSQDVRLTEGNVAVSVQTETTTEQVRYEVLAVDKNHQPTSLRVHLVSVVKVTDITAPAEKKGKTITSLKNVYFVAKRKGEEFHVDKTSVVTTGKPLTDAEKKMFTEEYLADEVVLPTSPRLMNVLLPTKPVPAGQTWKPSKAAQDAWAKNFEKQFATAGGKVKKVSGELQAVPAPQANKIIVTGEFVIDVVIGSTGFQIKPSFVATFDSKGNMWTGAAAKAETKLPVEGLDTVVSFTATSTAEHTPGKGKASAAPVGAKPVFSTPGMVGSGE